tara:strand:- start:1213 stop:1548 length:336 start_codon:yes stop_codon:yes gene_type:complete
VCVKAHVVIKTQFKHIKNMKKYKKLAILLLSIAIGVLAYYTPFPVWAANTIIALSVTVAAYKNINKVLEDNTPLKNNKALENNKCKHDFFRTTKNYKRAKKCVKCRLVVMV